MILLFPPVLLAASDDGRLPETNIFYLGHNFIENIQVLV
jgi:hypothetical protein